jgi:putative ABC transport system permease protein
LLAFISLLISLAVVQLALPSFNSLTQKDLHVTDPVMIGMILVITLLTGLFAGSYPAFLLSSLKPVVVLKGRFAGVGGKNLRKGLVVFQFSLSTVLIVCALVAHEQVKYLKEKDLGFDKNNILYFRASERIDRNLDGFKKSALENPKVIAVAESNSNPMQIFGGMVLGDDAWPGKTKDDNIIFTWTQADEDFVSLFNLQVVKGRNFSKDNAADSMNFIINEEAAKKMKLTDPIGAKLKAPHSGTIIGVVKNFHSNTLASEIQPTIIAMTPRQRPMVFVKYEPGQAQEALTSLQALYKTFEPDLPMEYKFIDASFGELYENELLIETLSLYFTIIAIFISCLGLFGLASFTAETRTKEIGVRKVLGASLSQIIALLGKDFLLLISFSLVIGLPLGWWGVERFLSKYVYHTEVGLWLLVVVALAMMGITVISVGYQSARAAMMNPVKTLRSE